MSGIPSYKELTRDINENLKPMRNDLSDVMKAFGDLAAASTKDGTLDKKTKELVALAIAVAVRCDGCIGFHVKALVHLGATLTEIEEVLGMSVYLGGGPSLMYAANAISAYKEFSGA